MDVGLEIAHVAGAEELRLVGELDRLTAPELREALAAMPRGRQVTLDLSELTFIDSSGLHAIVDFANATNGSGPVILEGASEMMLRLLEITKLAQDPRVEVRSRVDER